MDQGFKLTVPSLIVLFSAALLTLAKVLLFPATRADGGQPVALPAQIPLTGWQSRSSQTLNLTEKKVSQALIGQQYVYAQGETSLDITTYYLVKTDADVRQLLKASNPTLKAENYQEKQAGSGYYSLFHDQNRAYLSSCINPHGGSTVTSKQFKQNRNTYDVQTRFLPWLITGGELQDHRCLWTTLSASLGSSSPEVAYQKLESAWSPWYDWWSKNFPIPNN